MLVSWTCDSSTVQPEPDCVVLLRVCSDFIDVTLPNEVLFIGPYSVSATNSVNFPGATSVTTAGAPARSLRVFVSGTVNVGEPLF